MSTAEKPLVNRVASSGLITFNLENYYPAKPIYHFDLKDYLFRELILREKDYRSALAEHDWEQYRDGVFLVYCSTDAIIPVWAYMLVTRYVVDICDEIHLGDESSFLRSHYREVADGLDTAPYVDQRVIVKGCSEKPVPASAYLDISRKLLPVVKSLMYGEPCSTVPIFKKRPAPKK